MTSTKSKVFITGITGMVGSHMADFLLDKTEVVGLKRWRSPMDNVRQLEGKVKFVDGDLKDQACLIKILNKEKPDIIYHFAAQSYVPISYTMPAETLQDNILGTLNLLEAICLLGIDPLVIIASSSEVYGQVTNEDVPIKETCHFRPVSPYAVSKVAEDMLAYQYFKAYGKKIIRTRLFTHTGPRRWWTFVESLFAYQIALVEKGKQSCIYNHGNEESLKSVRTWLDVRDAVKAYWLLRTCTPGDVYNIGGDKTMTVEDMLHFLIANSTIKNIELVHDGKWLRPADVTLQIPDSNKFRKESGWLPEIPFETTMLDLLNYWRERV